MKKEYVQNLSNAGIIFQELDEIKKLQKQPNSFLTMWTNTCTGFYTVICC